LPQLETSRQNAASRFAEIMKKLLRLTALALLICLSISLANAANKKPNIIIILTDDLGYGDLSCYGHPSIRTPNLDRMAVEGLRFTDFYAGQSLCTPSRAALMTGRLPIRSGMAGGPGRHVLYPNNPGGLPPEEITIAEALKSAGYATGAIGKWHLGDLPDYLPTKNGFDSFFGLPYSNDSDWLDPKFRKSETMSRDPVPGRFNVPLLRGTNIIERPVIQETLTKRYTEEAIRFMEQNKKKPFFLYFAHTFPHVPLFASEKFKGKSSRGRYGDAVEEVDWSVGEVLNWLRKERLDENTFVIFTSDNGPWLDKKWNGGSGGALRDGKAGTWEGGYRVPAIVRWPGKISPGVTHQMASAMDLYPTALKLAGVEMPNDRPFDGIDMTPLLFNGKPHRDTQFYYYGDQLYAVRKGHYKAHFTTHDGYSKVPAEQHNPPLLFNVAEDPSERFDIAAEHPDIVAELT
jgi:arylsulfatase A-like enzyme